MIPRIASHRLLGLGLVLAACVGAGATTSTFAQNSFAEDVTARPSSAPQTVRPTQPVPGPNVSPRTTEPGGNRPAAAQDASLAGPSGHAASGIQDLETQDFGVEPTDRLRGEPLRGPTPVRIPGALVVTTGALKAMYEQGAQPFLVFDVLGGERGLPSAQNALPAGRPGSFDDRNQRDFGTYLRQVTQGRTDVPLVFYCKDVYCWMSYNAALRAVRLGFTNVLWYRGGIDAWEKAGLPTYPRQG
jgi:rhodanese-related sulfurtransferase